MTSISFMLEKCYIATNAVLTASFPVLKMYLFKNTCPKFQDTGTFKVGNWAKIADGGGGDPILGNLCGCHKCMVSYLKVLRILRLKLSYFFSHKTELRSPSKAMMMLFVLEQTYHGIKVPSTGIFCKTMTIFVKFTTYFLILRLKLHHFFLTY